MEYRIAFGNRGPGSATVVSVKDFLPGNLEYTNSQIVITNITSTHSNGMQ